MSNPSLLVNLSFLLPQPTGLSVYASQVYPHLKDLDPILLTARPREGFNCYPVPPNLTPAQGSRGHFNRLIWTQFALPKLYKKLNGSLLFSPISEAPLGVNIPAVVMVHDLIPLRYPALSPLWPYCRFYMPAVLNQAVHIVCNSQATADDLVTMLGIPAAKITPILLGYDRDHFRPGKPENQPDRPYFLYIGRHDPHKNVPRLVEAFAQTGLAGEMDLMLAGPTDRRYTPKLQALAEELGIKKALKIQDYVSYDQLLTLYQQAIALVFPSLWEGFGFPVLEAMACGTAVITSNCSSLPEVAGDSALLINPNSVEELASAMKTVAQDNRLRQQLEDRGYHRAQQFSWERTGTLTQELLAQFLSP